ncbi:MAG TPA: hemolysin III family protein [Steroidobacteraceae bacterium]|nr:hemolysin III family protein [Steroidobacteraceae bacterium]HQX46956.1 hemolysin III family protein [Steroidobacteraceae bacterium]HQX78222.1 hemolysin III family protein [Steroidobacteraceae bacterium]HQZ80157.1 hemolysin III family protein [Steroidobacteraceae bacterium]
MSAVDCSSLPAAMPAPHYRSAAERLADKWVHIVGIALAGVGALYLLSLSLQGDRRGQIAAVAIYGIGLIATFACSIAYNLTRTPARQRFLRRIDHAAIYLMIACSYTPFTTQCLQGRWAVGMTSAVWVIALAGIIAKLAFPQLPRKWSVAGYLALGWIALVALVPLIESVPRAALWLIAAGGFVYSLGVPVYIAKRLPFRRAIWHTFVIAAATLHWVAVLIGVVATPA